VQFESIRVLHGSTTNLKEGFGSFHSRATVMGGSAVLDAAAKFLEVVRERAALELGCTPAEVSFAHFVARSADGRSIDVGSLRGDGLAADGVFVSSLHTYSYGAHGAHVAVDARTGQVEVVDYVAVEDVGRIINPLLLRGQLLGAVVQGLGGVFLEHLVYDEEGQLLTGTLADYLLPTATDFPNVRAYVMDEHRSAMNPLGVKGAGEGGIIPVAGVIGNAVADALSDLGVQPRDLPLSPSRLWRLINYSR
jgi:aerobic carbon-monoxide dehydrogenase large subunit